MSLDEKTKEMIDESHEHEALEQPENDAGNKLETVVDGVKETAGKAAGLIGDAAKDVSEFAGEQLKTAKGIFNRVSKEMGDNLSRQRLEKFRPVFSDRIDSGELSFPEMIQIIDTDKRTQFEECKNAVAFEDNINKQEVLSVFKGSTEMLQLNFIPERNLSIYYVHPLDKTTYIEMSKYFSYLKEAKVAELEYIAQSLGAKYFKVSILEESNTENIKKVGGEAKLGFLKDKMGVKSQRDIGEKHYESLGVAAESRFTGKDPVKPELKYWASNVAIRSLVEQRMSPDNPLSSKIYRLDYNTSSGITEKEAAKIDGVLKSLKFSGAGSFSEAAKTETRRKFEYIIEF